MVNKNNGWYMNSLPLKFLFSPFKALYTIYLIILLIFGVSLLTQNYFKHDSLLEQEIRQLNYIGTKPIINNSSNNENHSINITVSRLSYQALSTIFFDWTQVNKSLQAKNKDDFGYKFKNYLMPRMHLLQHFDNTLKVIAIRLGNISLYLGLVILLYFLAAIDGLVMRAIRQSNASRESAGIYHRAKYWRVGITWLSLMLYLCIPVAIHPHILILPIGISTWMVFMQTKYLKKYL